LVTGGTGSFGHTFIPLTLEKYNPKKIVVFFRDEMKQEEIGIRPGKKLHEQMIGPEDALYTYEYPGHFKILPSINEWSEDPERIAEGKKVDPNFTYCSDSNSEWMGISELQEWITTNKVKIGSM